MMFSKKKLVFVCLPSVELSYHLKKCTGTGSYKKPIVKVTRPRRSFNRALAV